MNIINQTIFNIEDAKKMLQSVLIEASTNNARKIEINTINRLKANDAFLGLSENTLSLIYATMKANNIDDSYIFEPKNYKKMLRVAQLGAYLADEKNVNKSIYDCIVNLNKMKKSDSTSKDNNNQVSVSYFLTNIYKTKNNKPNESFATNFLSACLLYKLVDTTNNKALNILETSFNRESDKVIFN